MAASKLFTDKELEMDTNDWIQKKAVELTAGFLDVSTPPYGAGKVMQARIAEAMTRALQHQRARHNAQQRKPKPRQRGGQIISAVDNVRVR